MTMDWLHQGPDSQEKIVPDGARLKMLVLSDFLDKMFARNLKEIGQIKPDSTRISLRLQKANFL